MKNTALIFGLFLFTIYSCLFSDNIQDEMLIISDHFISIRVPSDIEGIELIVSYDPLSVLQDYKVEVSSSISESDSYSTERGVDNGLIFLVNEDIRQVEEYIIPQEDLVAIIHVIYDMDVFDKTDVILTAKNVVIVHTTISNAGIFTRSDVYVLPFPETGFEYIDLFNRSEEVHINQMKILYAALLFYYINVQ